MAKGAKPNFALRDLCAEDMPAAHVLSRAVHWPHRLADWNLWLRAGAGLAAVVDDALIGTVMYWTYGETHASLGMLIVSPQWQGAGIGRALMQGALERLGPRTVVLNATREGMSLCESLGFTSFGSIYQHQGAAFSVPLTAMQRGDRVRPMGASDTAAVVSLDERAGGMERDLLLRKILMSAQGVMLDRSGEPAGFALLRRFGEGYAVGPAAAPDPDSAKALIAWWLGANAGAFCRLDAPESSSSLSGWLESLGLPCVNRVTRMVRGAAPPSDAAMRTFAIANQSFG